METNDPFPNSLFVPRTELAAALERENALVARIAVLEKALHEAAVDIDMGLASGMWLHVGDAFGCIRAALAAAVKGAGE